MRQKHLWIQKCFYDALSFWAILKVAEMLRVVSLIDPHSIEVVRSDYKSHTIY